MMRAKNGTAMMRELDRGRAAVVARQPRQARAHGEPPQGGTGVSRIFGLVTLRSGPMLSFGRTVGASTRSAISDTGAAGMPRARVFISME